MGQGSGKSVPLSLFLTAEGFQHSSTALTKNTKKEEEGITPLPEVITRETCANDFGFAEAAKSTYLNLSVISH